MVGDYNPTGFALEIFQKKHALHEHETWQEGCQRVASVVAAAEEGSSRSEWAGQFYNELVTNRFSPGGRIWYGAGRPRGQMQNCFALEAQDSREGWGDAAKEMIIISGTGGGVGINCSHIRPRGSIIHGTGGKATGSVSLMKILNAANEVIVAGGERRGALLFGLNLNHGDIIEFLDKKLDLNELTSANISVIFNENPELFFEKVKKDEDFELIFRGKILACIKAKDLWLKIITNALKSGEPGLLNGYLANRMSNTYWINDLCTTNPCGEVWLSVGESCCLGSLILPRFINPTGAMEWKELKKTIGIAVRLLDDVLTVNNYPLSYIAETCKNLRRIGLGITGLHDMLLLKGLRYNSDEGLEFVDKVMEFIKNETYLATIELAKEKGAFPLFETEKYLKSNFIKTLKPSIRSQIKEFGVRNCATLSLAPTGTISIIAGCTQGIEPLYAPATLTRYRDIEGLQEKIVVHPLFQQYIKEEKDISHFQGAYDLLLEDHFEMQRICQRHLDNSCSKTINVMPGTSPSRLSDLYMEYFPELKGVTIYPEGSRENQPLTALNLDEAIKYAKEDSKPEIIEARCRLGNGCG